MKNMSLSLRSFPNQQLVMEFALSGNLDAVTLKQLERGFRERLMSSKFSWIIDLGGLDCVSGDCFESFVSDVEELRLKGGYRFLVRVPPKIQAMFERLGFNLVFRTFLDEEGALESCLTPEFPEDEGSLISSRYGA